MTNSTEPRQLPATPSLDALLARLEARITTQVWMHGLGTAIAFAAAWFLFAFVLDWWLHLPAAIRVFHLVVMIALPTIFLVRELYRPLSKRPDRAGLAVLVERAHPELREVLVSAVQFRASPAQSGDPVLVDAVLREAEARSKSLSLDRVLDPRGPRRRFALGALAGGFAVFVLVWNAAAAGIFLARIAGGSTPWPQRTHLSIEVPVAAGQGSLGADGAASATPGASAADTNELVVRVARGSDVPIVVHAEGVVPEEVDVHFQDGHKVVLTSSGGATFRTLLRSVQEDMSFFATGGDDVDEVPRVRLRVLQPPDVAGLALELEPPAYSGLPARTEFDRDVEVLAGTRVRVHVRCDPPTARGKARLLPEDRLVDLTPAPFPLTPDEITAKTAPKTALGFEIAAEKSLRFRFELVDDTGLTNPDPGLFGIAVVDDRAPEVEVLAPSRGDFDTVPGGLISLRTRAEDDFGIARLAYSVSVAGVEANAAKSIEHELTPTPVDVDANASKDATDRAPRAGRASTVRVAVLARARVEVASLGGKDPVTEGQQFQLIVTATDNCAPKAHEGRSAPLRVRVVSSDEFLRRLQDRMSRAQTSAAALAELQREKNRRVDELLAVLESDGPEAATGELNAAVTGQRRVQGDARALARELCSATEGVLYARLDERAAAALEMLEERFANSTGRAFDAAPWRDVAAASRDRAIAGSGLAGKLVDISGLALEISEDLAQAATDELARAGEAVELSKVHDRLKSASAAQKKTLAKIDALLERLAEWDNFQSVLTLTRDILNGQKTLNERTRQAAKDK